MPRRNLQALCLLILLSAACYLKADASHRSEVGRMFETFSLISKEIDQRYVEPVERREVFEGALHGMVSVLDQHSAYIPPNENDGFTMGIKGEYGGIGIEISWDDREKILTVFAPIVGSPAYEKGILAGDRIVTINDRPVDQFADLQEARQAMLGPVGSSIKLHIARAGIENPIEFELNRANIQLESVLGDRRFRNGDWDYLLEGHKGVGYVRVTRFTEKTVDELKTALAWLSERDCRGLVLDLRDDLGGLLESAVQVSDLFVPSGTIVSIRGREGEAGRTFTASGDAPYANWKMVVLVNHNTASASEIVAACLQDHGRAAIVGERTFGKGSVQDVIPLEDGKSSLKLTTASYWRPSGKDIHKRRKAADADEWGVLPDPGWEVKFDTATYQRQLIERRNRDAPLPDPGQSDSNSADAAPVDVGATGASPQPSTPYVDEQLKRAVERLNQLLDEAQQ